MPQKYSPLQKAAALVLLERNSGNFPLTVQQTGISRSTLYEWQSEIQAFFQENTPSIRQPAELPVFSDDLETLAFIRKQIMDEMLRLAVSLKDDPGHSTPYQRVKVLAQLMDRLMKLDHHLQPYVDDDADDWLEGAENEERDGDGYEYYNDELGWYHPDELTS
jgi:hypothetical protein